MKIRMASRIVVLARALRDHADDDVSNWVLYGEGGSLIFDGSRSGLSDETFGMRDTAAETRSYSVGLCGGARKAIEKSVSPMGEEGVTMMAGRAAFSSTRGSDKSETRYVSGRE